MLEGLTIVIPVKNEEKNLAGCLESVRDFKHVVLVDSGSTDRTREIFEAFVARMAGASCRWECVDFRWDGKFPKKRNWVLRNYKFQTPWALFLDADERMTKAFTKELGAFFGSPVADCFDILTCVYDNWFAGRLLKHGDAMRKTAIVRVGAAEYEKIDEDRWSDLDMEIHEHLQLRRKGAECEIAARLEHHDRRSLESHWKKHIQYASWEAGRYRQLMAHPERWDALTLRQKRKYGNITKWWLAPAYFVVCYFLKRGFLDGIAGLRFAWFKLRYFRLVRAKILGRDSSSPRRFRRSR